VQLLYADTAEFTHAPRLTHSSATQIKCIILSSKSYIVLHDYRYYNIAVTIIIHHYRRNFKIIHGIVHRRVSSRSFAAINLQQILIIIYCNYGINSRKDNKDNSIKDNVSNE